ncbi:hypothetical protein QYE76_027061 [Lolium multiflorum]|uniref:CCHC-type domain-containing protein n=1 Tax=Lolium multiflorum TaxID=4521 RepID=A0AAD8VE95_LOLMU|nr:hypothetical protein QYE76_027061 [Lolium multiflorum]
MEEDSSHHQAPSEESVRPHQRQNNDDQDEGHGRPPPPQQQRNNNEDAQGPQPQPQQRQAHGEERPPPRRNDRNEEEIFGKLKFTMPKFQGEEDPDAYLSWVLKVDKIFRIHNFSEAKKVAMASLEFEGYANVWWEEVNKKREKEDLAPIDTWEEMQEVMHTRFVPTHHKRDLFNKLTQLKQSYKSVEEYYKEMHMTMMSANVDEREEQTMARFLNGLNIPVKRIVEFLPYKNMVELLHQATRAERQVREDLASAKTKTFFAARNAMNASSSIKNTSALASKDPPKQARSTIKTTSFKPEQSTMSSKASTGSSNITCFKCGAQGHKSFECKNTRVMITRDDGDVEYLSEGEYEALVQAATSHEDDALEDQEQVLCVHDASPSLVVTKVLTTHALPNEDQRCNIFQTRAGINGKSIKVIIDGGSCHNLASTELCTKLNLPLRKHPHPYHVQWLSDNGNVKIQHTVTISFKIGAYEDTVDCDVVPMTVCHMLLGRPWQYDKKANHDGYTNAYSFKVNDKTYILRPMTPSQVIADNAKALARAKEATITSELRGERVIHQKESERQKPYVSEMKSVLLATKSEMREVHHNPSTTLHYVLICKGPSEETNDLTNIPSSLLSLLKEFQDVFPDELPHGLPPLRGIEHRIDLIPGAPLPNRAAYRTNPEDTKEIQRQIQDLLTKGPTYGLRFIMCVNDKNHTQGRGRHGGRKRRARKAGTAAQDDLHCRPEAQEQPRVHLPPVLVNASLASTESRRQVRACTTSHIHARAAAPHHPASTPPSARLASPAAAPLAPPLDQPRCAHLQQLALDPPTPPALARSRSRAKAPPIHTRPAARQAASPSSAAAPREPSSNARPSPSISRARTSSLATLAFPQQSAHALAPSRAPNSIASLHLPFSHPRKEKKKNSAGTSAHLRPWYRLGSWYPGHLTQLTTSCGCSDIDDAIAMEMRDSTICEMSDSTICEMSDSTICELDECLHFESMSDTPSSMDDETPIMEKMYMVHEDDDITPCLLLEDEHGGHMEPTTSTTPTSYERDYKGMNHGGIPKLRAFTPLDLSISFSSLDP